MGETAGNGTLREMKCAIIEKLRLRIIAARTDFPELGTVTHNVFLMFFPFSSFDIYDCEGYDDQKVPMIKRSCISVCPSSAYLFQDQSLNKYRLLPVTTRR